MKEFSTGKNITEGGVWKRKGPNKTLELVHEFYLLNSGNLLLISGHIQNIWDSCGDKIILQCQNDLINKKNHLMNINHLPLWSAQSDWRQQHKTVTHVLSPNVNLFRESLTWRGEWFYFESISLFSEVCCRDGGGWRDELRISVKTRSLWAHLVGWLI